MREARLYGYGDIRYWTANYAEGGADLEAAAMQNFNTQDKPTYHIRPAELTAERRADVDRSFEGYVRLNTRHGYRTQEEAYHDERPVIARVYTPPRKTLVQKIHDFFVEEAYE